MSKSVSRGVVLVAVCLLISSCAGRPESNKWHSKTSFTQKVGYFTSQCLQIGFKRDTDQLRICVSQRMDASQNRASAKTAAEDAAILNSILFNRR